MELSKIFLIAASKMYQMCVVPLKILENLTHPLEMYPYPKKQILIFDRLNKHF